MDFFAVRSPRDLINMCHDAKNLEKLRRFLFRVAVYIDLPGRRRDMKRYIKKLVPRAGYYAFDKAGVMTTVKVSDMILALEIDLNVCAQDHFAATYNKIISEPELFGVQFDGEALYPAELCVVTQGQRYKKKLDPDQTRVFLGASTKKPDRRLKEITDAVGGHVSDICCSVWDARSS